MDQKYDLDRPEPRLVGSTGLLYRGSVAATSEKEASQLAAGNIEHSQRSHGFYSSDESNYFKSAQWSPDGTTIITSSADNNLRSFILPVDLLSSDAPHDLVPYAFHRTPEPTYATSVYPSFDLQSPSSCLFLASPRSLPIRLLSPLSSAIIATYPLISLTTEDYIAPHSLLFSPENPNHFLAGSDNLICTFDINRNGEGPMNRMPTIASRRSKLVGGGGMKGIVSTLGISCDGVLAAGTFSRWIGLYDGYGRGGTQGVFEIKGDREETLGGTGVTQVLWSACGRYLCTAERNSDGLGVWDIRGTGKRLAWLGDRHGMTNQRLGTEIVGSDVWAGGTDGLVRVWEGLGMRQGVVDPVWEFHAHDDAVSSTTLHPWGTVLATCSGQRAITSTGADVEDVESDINSDMSIAPSSSLISKPQETQGVDNSLKIWALST